jgi:cellulose synthase/poly-beta-1,6-N-acetylglucosamine synthase-like glycosyltransferase
MYHLIKVELARQLPLAKIPADATRLRALICYRMRPLGWVDLPIQSGQDLSTDLLQAAQEKFGWRLPGAWLAKRFVPPQPTLTRPSISVVVCTRDRPHMLAKCLEALRQLDYSAYEVIVVDNAPSTDETAQLTTRFNVRYIREMRPGLDWARNRGIAAAQNEIIAFTDDDACPDPQWLGAIAEGFSEQEVMAVTGLIVPAELATEAQMVFEFGYGGMSHGFRRRVIRRSVLTDYELLWASAFGTGANMAFRREVFDAIGQFDVALDVGTASGGGGDIELLHRLVMRGHTLVYEPAALVWHSHRQDMSSLRRQLFNHGRGFGSYLLTCARNRTVSRLAISGFALRQWLGWWCMRRMIRPGGFPRRLVALELIGMLSSPWAYHTAQIRASRLTERI